MKITVATDIFGINQDIELLLAELTLKSTPVQLVSPYSQTDLVFDHEQAAYQAFQKSGGVLSYAEKLSKLNVTAQDVLLGFSAGAASLWKCLADNQQLSCVQMVGFYPSQIRHYLGRPPRCPVTLLFPNQEPHFDVNTTIETLSKWSTINCIQTPYKHGFMNPRSKNFSVTGFSEYKSWLNDALNNSQF